jgi:hypothetical protein
LEGLGEDVQWVGAKDVDTQAHDCWLNDDKEE